MAAILASNSCTCRHVELMSQGARGSLSFSHSVSNPKFSNYHDRTTFDSPTKSKTFRFQVEARQTELPAKFGSNGRAIKMVPIDEVVKKRTPSINGVETLNGSTKKIVYGPGLVKRDSVSVSAIVKSPKVINASELPHVDELQVLPSDEGFSWAKDNYNSWQRSIDVWSFVLSLRTRVLFDNAKWVYFGGFTEDKQKIRRRKTASWLRESVLQLGPTFIKLGQLSSTRSDLFPTEFVEELAKLQDRVPAFSKEKARSFIEAELGNPIEVLFKEFEDRPIAAASLGQVSLHDSMLACIPPPLLRNENTLMLHV